MSGDPKLLYVIGEATFFRSHFLDRAQAAQRAGFDVAVATRGAVDSDPTLGPGVRRMALWFRRGAVDPLALAACLWSLRRLLRHERPAIVHVVGIPLILLTAMAVRTLNAAATPILINAPVGMGYVFSSDALKARLLRPVVRLGLRALLQPQRGAVVFENADDRAALIAARCVRAADAVLIRGSGVDGTRFAPRPEPQGPVTVVLAARMLRDKGVHEFVAAAQALRAAGVAARLLLIGAPDPDNPTSIPEAMLRAWDREGAVAWLGWRGDMAAVLAAAHIACLPSYREGLPRFLVEAAAAGRPIVATDVPGCREVVVEGETGLLVPPRDAAALAAASRRLIDDPALRERLGRGGRRRAETLLSNDRVIADTMALYRRWCPLGDQGEQG